MKRILIAITALAAALTVSPKPADAAVIVVSGQGIMRQGTIGGLAGTTITDIRTGVAVAGGIATGIIGKTA